MLRLHTGDDTKNVVRHRPPVDVTLVVADLVASIAADSAGEVKPLSPVDFAKNDVTHLWERVIHRGAFRKVSVDRSDRYQLSRFDAGLHAVAVRPELDDVSLLQELDVLCCPHLVAVMGIEPTTYCL